VNTDSAHAEALFEKKNVVAIGWEMMGDLSHFKTREDFKKRYEEVYPDVFGVAHWSDWCSQRSSFMSGRASKSASIGRSAMVHRGNPWKLFHDVSHTALTFSEP
jgi:hypothetical protein